MPEDQIVTSEGYQSKLIWSATYKDNVVFSQYENGEERSSEYINRSRLASFALYDLGGNKYIEQHYKPGQLFMYRCRTAMKTGHNVIERIHIIVCQDGEKRHVIFVFESDLHIEVGDFIDASNPLADQHKWLYPLEAVPADLIPVG